MQNNLSHEEELKQAESKISEVLDSLIQSNEELALLGGLEILHKLI